MSGEIGHFDKIVKKFRFKFLTDNTMTTTMYMTMNTNMNDFVNDFDEIGHSGEIGHFDEIKNLKLTMFETEMRSNDIKKLFLGYL